VIQRVGWVEPFAKPISENRRVSLCSIHGITAELNGFVARRDEDATFVKFELSEAADKIIGQWLTTRLAA
jgi:hypothetical protein